MFLLTSVIGSKLSVFVLYLCLGNSRSKYSECSKWKDNTKNFKAKVNRQAIKIRSDISTRLFVISTKAPNIACAKPINNIDFENTICFF